ncbi:hypothetical protein [Abyssisolibacter fermentans]|uniref:hypothetical protein n=1 Tax=Abyssisolibacter fermentans TaxID=1766203 RepID=UPI00192E4764|nr:hypothetical protein [Abyssisolibacter fermentans]
MFNRVLKYIKTGADNLLFFFLLIAVILNNCTWFIGDGQESTLFFFLLIAVLFGND